MTIYRGPGGGGNSNSDAEISALAALSEAAEQAAEDAAQSATDASASAVAASTSATSAAASASAASTSAAQASSSASAASTSASNASISAASAANSAIAASNSASAASTSATNAASSATAAASSATSAASSATAASTSATNAASSASSATISANSAANSATAAATSATNAASSATSAASSASAAAASYDSFDDRYLGVETVDPSTDNDANPLLTGALYFNSVSNVMKVYTGSAWSAAYVSGSDYLPLSGGILTGNLGIGGVTPSAALDVNGLAIVGSSSAASGITIYRRSFTPTSAQSIGVLRFASTNDGSTQVVAASINGFAAEAWTGSSTASYLTFNTNATGALGTTERMRLDAAGNLGIGTSSPGARLDVTSAAAFSARISGPSNVYQDITDGTGTLRLQLLSNAPYITSIGAYPVSFGTNNTERMRITSTGDVGIGTASPAVKLTVTAGGSTNTVTSLFTAGPSDGSFRAGFANGSGTTSNSEQAAIGMWYGTGFSSPLCHIGFLRGGGADSAGITLNVGNTERVRINSSGQLETGIAGSASAPSFTRSGDLNTGIFFPAADTIAFAEGGAESMRIDASGNLLVGRTSVSNAAVKVDAEGLFGSIKTGSWSYSFGANASTNAFVVNETSSGSAVERMRVDALGNLGLGVTPSAWASGWRAFQTVGGNSFYSDATVSALGSNVVFDGASWKYIATAGAGTYQINRNSHNWFVAPSGTAGTSITLTQAMTLNSSGNLGVGSTPSAIWRARITSTGQQVLQLEAPSTATNPLASNPSLLLHNTNATNGNFFSVFGMDSTVGGLTSGYALVTDTHGASFSGSMRFYTADAASFAERMRISSAGLLGLGTSSPQSRLHVVGEAGTTLVGRVVSQVSSGSYLGFFDTSTTDRPMVGAVGDAFVVRTGSVESIRLNSSGNLGVGTASPGARLHVDSGASSEVLRLNSTGDTYIQFQRSGTSTTYLQTTAAAFYFWNQQNTPILFGANNTERMRLTAGGALGIGTSLPSSLLDVNGDTVRVRTARTPASASASGNAGDICWDSNYVYVCVATNTWKRAALATW